MNIKRVSRWIRLRTAYDITERHSLYDYCHSVLNGLSPMQDGFDNSLGNYLDYFVFNKRKYALDNFINRYVYRFGMLGLDSNCKDLPEYIAGYEFDNNYKPLMCELSSDGKYIRLYQEV